MRSLLSSSAYYFLLDGELLFKKFNFIYGVLSGLKLTVPDLST